MLAVQIVGALIAFAMALRPDKTRPNRADQPPPGLEEPELVGASGSRSDGGHEDHRARRELDHQLRRRRQAALSEAQATIRNIEALDVVSIGLRGDNLDEWRALVRDLVPD